MNKIKVLIIAGKSHVGKDTVSNIIKEKAKEYNLKVIKLQFSTYIKMYAKLISNWDGLEEDKPRELLQNLGSEIRDNYNNLFFVNRMIDDIKILSKYADIITITDARLPFEIDEVAKRFNAYKIYVRKDNAKANMTDKEKNHITEKALDNYNDFDYIIDNNGNLEDLKNRVETLFSDII